MNASHDAHRTDSEWICDRHSKVVVVARSKLDVSGKRKGFEGSWVPELIKEEVWLPELAFALFQSIPPQVIFLKK